MAIPGDSAWMRALKKSSQHHRDWQMALAISLGLMLGLLPKYNLLAAALALVILVMPVHTLLAIVSSIFATCLMPAISPLENQLGMMLLEHPKTQFVWEYCDSALLLPWMGLTNSVVIGGFAIGLALFYPVFLCAYTIFRSRKPKVAKTRQRSSEVLALTPPNDPPKKNSHFPAVGPQPFAKQEHTHHTQPALHWHMHHKPIERIDSRTQLATISRVAEPLEIKQPLHEVPKNNREAFLDEPILRFDFSGNLTAVEVAQRAEQLARWADEALSECLDDQPWSDSHSHSAMDASQITSQPQEVEGSETNSLLPADATHQTETNVQYAGPATGPRIYTPADGHGTMDGDQADSLGDDTVMASMPLVYESEEAENSPRKDNVPLLSPESRPRTDTSQGCMEPICSDDDSWLVETTIEVVRLAEQVVANKSSTTPSKEQTAYMQSIPNLLSLPHASASPTLTQIPLLDTAAQRALQNKPHDPSSVTQVAGNKPKELTPAATVVERVESAHGVQAPMSIVSGMNNSSSARPSPAQSVNSSGNREEALRYLLRHLRDIREKV